MDKIKLTAGKGFHLTIGDYTLSVQLGHSNYCSRQDYSKFEPETGTDIESPDCEIAIWMSDDYGKWVTNKVVKKVLKETPGEVMGWVSPLLVGKLISWMTQQAVKKAKKLNQNTEEAE